MSQSQHSPSVWSVSQGEAVSLSIGPGPRELSVTEGRLWLTLRGELDEQPEDHWLEPGQSVHLESGSRVVMEAWPQAQFQLLVPPCEDFVRQQAARAAANVKPFWRRILTSSLTASSSSSQQRLSAA